MPEGAMPAADGAARRQWVAAAMAILTLAGLAGWVWFTESEGNLAAAARQQAARVGRSAESIKGWATNPAGRFGMATAVDLYYDPPPGFPDRPGTATRGATACFWRSSALRPWIPSSFTEGAFRVDDGGTLHFIPDR